MERTTYPSLSISQKSFTPSSIPTVLPRDWYWTYFIARCGITIDFRRKLPDNTRQYSHVSNGVQVMEIRFVRSMRVPHIRFSVRIVFSIDRSRDQLRRCHRV